MVIAQKAPFRALLIALIGLILSACGPAKTPEMVVQERSTARWEAIMERDYEAEYELHSPGFRSVKSERAHVNYRNAQPVRWTDYEIQGVTCESAEVCKVVVKVYYEVRAQVALVGTHKSFSNTTETWVNTGGSWYYLPRDVGK